MGSQSNNGQVLGIATGVGTIGTGITMLPQTSGNSVLLTLGIISAISAGIVLVSFLAVVIYRRVTK